MLKSIRSIVWILPVLIGLAGWTTIAAAREDEAASAAGKEALALRLAEIAQNNLRAGQITPPLWRLSAALLEAAGRLDPDQPRYPRLAAEAMLQVGDVDGAITTLNAYRKLQPDDQLPQIQLIDLYISRMETADAKIAYLSNLLGKSAIADEVRSHAAVQSAKLMMERTRWEQAKAMLSQSLRLSPLNPEALQLWYELIARHGSAYERISAQLAMLRGNPGRPHIMADLARELADAGLIDQSLDWYATAMNLGQSAGVPLTREFVRGYASELFLSDQAASAPKFLDPLLETDPNDIEAWLLKLVFERNAGDPVSYEISRRQALNVLDNRLAAIQQAAAGGPAATQPAASTQPVNISSLSEDIKRIGSEQPHLRDAYVLALADLAWLHLYFNEQPEAAAEAIKGLELILPQGNVTVARLAGWKYLMEGKSQEAGVKLSAIADQDPLAALGMIRLAENDSKGKESADAMAQKLLNENPSGLMGAIVWDALRDRGVKRSLSPSAQAIQAELRKFPVDWLRILDEPQRFYTIIAEPLQVSHKFGEAMMARVTIQNLSDYDLTVGPDGVIRPDLWFDAQLRGLAQQDFSGIAYERISQRVVLRARQKMSQLVRIDQGTLAQWLAENPTISIQIFASVLTNPASIPTGVAPGPGGQRQPFKRILERTGFALSMQDARLKLHEKLESGRPEEKIRGIDLMAACVRAFPQKEENQLQPQIAELMEAIHKAGLDDSPMVRSWATYESALLAPPEVRREMIERMAEDSMWENRLLGLTAALTLPLPIQQQIVQRLLNDEDETIRKCTAAIVELTNQTTTPPTATQPRDQ